MKLETPYYRSFVIERSARHHSGSKRIYRLPVKQSYIVLWSADRWKWLKRIGEAGTTLEVLYGGVHTSTPSFSRYSVMPGDRVYVVMVRDGRLHVLASMDIVKYLSIPEYLREYLNIPEDVLRLHLWDMEKTLREARPTLGHRLPYGCIDEALVGENGTPFRFDREVPLDIVERLTFRNKQGRDRSVKVEEGKFKSVTGIQGHVLRLAPDSAEDFADFLDQG